MTTRAHREADLFLAELLGTPAVGPPLVSPSVMGAAPPAWPEEWETCDPAPDPGGAGEAAAEESWDPCPCAHDAEAAVALRAPARRAPAPAGEDVPAPAAGSPTPTAAAVCARDVAVTDTIALLVTSHAPLPVTASERRRVAGDPGALDDYRAVCAVVPAAPQERLLVFFHGNNNFVTVGPGPGPSPAAAARVPRWVDAPPALGRGTRAAIAAKPSATLGYALDQLAAAQARLTAPALASLAAKDPLVLVPEDAERTTGKYWSVPPRGQYGARDDAPASGSGTTRLQELVGECYEHLRCLRTPSGRPYLAASAAGVESRASYLSNVRRVYLCGHSGGGKPLVECAGADLALVSPSSVMGVGGRAAELWLFDCTYGFGTHNYVRFCERWQGAGLLGHRADGARLVCVYRPADPGSDTESEADALRAALAGVLGVSAASLRKLHDSSDLSSRSMLNEVIPALTTAPVVFVRTEVAHDRIPTAFAPLLLRTAAS